MDTLDELISNFDTVRYTVYNNSQNALRFKKKMQDGTHIALEVISNKNHTLRTHTLFLEQADFENKKRNIFPTLNEFKNSLSKTSETDGLSIPSANNVSQSNSSVKSNTSTKYSISKTQNNTLKLEDRVSGNELLNAQDLINELSSVGANIDDNGYVTVYHATTPENALEYPVKI